MNIYEIKISYEKTEVIKTIFNKYNVISKKSDYNNYIFKIKCNEESYNYIKSLI